MRRIRWRKLKRLSSRLGLGRDWYFVLLAALIGTFTAGVAMAFMWLIHLPLHYFGQSPKSWQVGLILTAPIAGALACGVIVHYLASEARGHGVPEVLHAINRNKSRIKLRVAIAKISSSICTIGTGGSAGAEGPIVQIGSALGSNVGRFLGTNPQNTATMLGCGAAAGIASVFNAPIAGIFFVLEILLRDFSLRTFTPIVIAAVFSAAVTQAVRGGNEEMFHLLESMHVGAFKPVELPNYLLLGIVCGAAAMIFVRALYFTEDTYQKLKLHPILKPVTGAAVLGLLGLAYMLLFTPSPGQVPPFYGNGYPIVEQLLSQQFYAQDTSTARLLIALLAICLFKGVATCLTVGSGGSGGVFAPSLMLGACVGGAFGVLVDTLDWAAHASPAHYALVGMAAVVAATTHAPLTAILIVYEITRNYQIILPLMLAAVISTIVARLIMRESIYTLKLHRRGIRIGAMSDLTLLRRMSVSDVELVEAVTVEPTDSAQRLLDLSEMFRVGDFVVIDDRGHYVGMVTNADLQAALVYREAIPLLQVSELQRSDLPTVTLEDTLDIVMDKFARHDVYSLAVLAPNGEGSEVRGLITRSRLMARYQRALARE